MRRSTLVLSCAVALGCSTPAFAQAGAVAAPDAITLANGKVRLGVVFYGDYAFYTQTGFGPQFLTQTNFPGPGNDHFNTFDVTRTYINMTFIPADWVSFRLTPNLFRQAGGATPDKLGKVSGIGASVDGNLAVRIKYAYLEFGKVFDGSTAFKGTNIRFGSQTNPLVDWEEAFYGYRFVNLVPWNYLSLSSTQFGASLNGSAKRNGRQYLDFQVGVFNDANFHQFEQSKEKQFMVRGSFYPMGAASRFQGLGLTAFYDRGDTNAAPDAGAAPVKRAALLVHFASPHNGAGLMVEYDYGRNAFGAGNMFSGGAPQDLVGLGATRFASMSQLAAAVLAGTGTKQKGFAVLGRVNIPNSIISVFGTWQYFQPNTKVPDDPLDFDRVVAGVAFKLHPSVRLAIDSQNLLYRRSQFTYPASSIAAFSPSLAAANPGGIPNAVPRNTNAIFVNVEFTF